MCDKAAAAKAQRAFDEQARQVEEWKSQRRTAQVRFEAAASDFAFARDKLDEIDRGLLGVAQPLATLEFDLTGLSATVDGKYVYELELSSPYKELVELNKAIGGVGEELARMRAIRKEAFNEFVAAHTFATQRAIELAAAIWTTERNKAAVKAGIFAVDVLTAAAEAGVIGVGLELLKKGHEALYDNAANAVRDPDPDIDVWARDALTATFTQKTVTNTLVDRAYRATVVEKSKDIVTEHVIDTLIYQPMKQGKAARLASGDVAGGST